ncbi:MAG TPA: hypothetical protein VMR18_02170 [Candidatus Saccharimonadales bacterium]|nr:hypothetical protein [Candidatus Saccharimonadales bacterium]
MSVSKEDRERYLRDAEKFENMKDEVGKRYLDNFMFIKAQISDWYIALTAVCFAVGAVAITVGSDKTISGDILHPALFWWGSLLLIANGTFIFLVRKVELEGESSGMPNLRKTEADMWTARNIARELADGNDSRVNEFAEVKQRILDDYDKRTARLKWWQWIGFLFHASIVDIVFGLLLFPILMLSSQLLNDIHMSFTLYSWGFGVLLVGYVTFTAYQAFKMIGEKNAAQANEEQIKSEVEK